MKQFTRDARAKGWLLVDLASRWNLTPRQLDRIAGTPKQVHLDALAGLSDRSGD